MKISDMKLEQACRSVPSILLTSSADDYESDYDVARSETPGSMYSARVASPPPTQIIVEEARQLPVCEYCRSLARIQRC